MGKVNTSSSKAEDLRTQNHLPFFFSHTHLKGLLIRKTNTPVQLKKAAHLLPYVRQWHREATICGKSEGQTAAQNIAPIPPIYGLLECSSTSLLASDLERSMQLSLKFVDPRSLLLHRQPFSPLSPHSRGS